MTYMSTINAFQGTLAKFSFDEPSTFSEDFAQKRFRKKFQVPDASESKVRKQKCWDDWIAYDQSLSKVNTSCFMRFPLLYKARHELHRKMSSRVRYDSWDMPQGSEYCPTLGQNSIESRLSRSTWTCTYDGFEQFARFVYTCKAMKRAFRKRYSQWFSERYPCESQRRADKQLHRRCKAVYCDPDWESFSFKLSQVVDFVQGSRFLTVPKNNEVDRPINIEPIGNMVVQRQIGNFLRDELKRLYSKDLDTLADEHRKMISDKNVSTIDLKNASDSVTLSLCQFLLPKNLYSALLKSRSPYVLGLDKAFHSTQKISSMGNGFTFELMTLILTSIARQFDPKASVFGDDIIISNEHAQGLIDLLQGVGFTVNLDKTFVSSPFRESCGANYHDEEGYIESYDFRWPRNIHDCVVIYNKALRLSRLYSSFESLRTSLRRHIPKALQGSTERDFYTRSISYVLGATDPPELSGLFRCDRSGFKTDPKLDSKLEAYCLKYDYTRKDVAISRGFTYKEELRSPTLKDLGRRHWAKYEMYLYSGMRSKDIRTGSGSWVECLYLSVAGATTRWSDSALV